MAKTKKTPAYVDKAIAWLEKNAPPGEKMAFINDEEAALLKSRGGSGEETVDGVRSYATYQGQTGRWVDKYESRSADVPTRVFVPDAVQPAATAPAPVATGQPILAPSFPVKPASVPSGQISVPKPTGNIDLSIQDQMRIHPDLSLPIGLTPTQARSDVSGQFQPTYQSGRFKGMTPHAARKRAVREWQAGTLTVPSDYTSIPTLEALGHKSGPGVPGADPANLAPGLPTYLHRVANPDGSQPQYAPRVGGAEAIRQAEQTLPAELAVPAVPEVPQIDVPEFTAQDRELVSPEGLAIPTDPGAAPAQQVADTGITPAGPTRVPAATAQAVKAGDTGQALAATQAAPTAVIGDIQETIPPDELAQAATADLDERATVQYQLAQVTSTIKEGQPLPSWAAPAARNADALMLQRGLGASSMAASARTQALIEAGLPIASADAQADGRIQLQNLNNMQQTALQNANTLAAMRTENLNARMTGAVNNARNFLAIDTANLTNAQAASTLSYNAYTQKLFNDQAAENAAQQFNATSTNQVEQYFTTLEQSVAEANANRLTAIRQFNVGEKNAYEQFLTNQQLSRDQFNSNQLSAIRAANSNWYRNIATINNGNQMAANSYAAKALLGLRDKEYNALWQKRRDDATFIYTSVENVLDREEAAAARAQQSDIAGKNRKSSTTNSIISGVASLGLGALMKFSDIRLKTNIEKIGSLNPVINLYRWEWNEVADELGVNHHPTVGVLAQELIEHRPDLVHMGDDGYFRVNYGGLFA